MTTKTTALTDCRFCGSEIGARDQFCGGCGKKQHPDHKAIDVLPPHQQENWQLMEYWSYANDGEVSSCNWGEGPKFLGLTLAQWVAVADKAPEVIAAFELEDAVGRWHSNDHIYDRGDAYDALSQAEKLRLRRKSLMRRTRAPQLDASPAWIKRERKLVETDEIPF